MLFRVLYTHQKLKKRKTWQDGFLQRSLDGQKATLLSDEKRKLDTLHIAREKVCADAELESDKYLIQVEEEIIFGGNIPDDAVIGTPLQTIPKTIQKVVVKRQGLAQSKGNRKGFKPPLINGQAQMPFSLQTERNKDKEASLPIHGYLAHELGSRHINENKRDVNEKNSNETFRNLYAPPSQERSSQSIYEATEKHFFSSVDSCNDGFLDLLDENHLDAVRNRSRESTLAKTNQCLNAENKGMESKQITPRDSFPVKRSADQILALFSKRSRASNEESEIDKRHCMDTASKYGLKEANMAIKGLVESESNYRSCGHKGIEDLSSKIFNTCYGEISGATMSGSDSKSGKSKDVLFSYRSAVEEQNFFSKYPLEEEGKDDVSNSDQNSATVACNKAKFIPGSQDLIRTFKSLPDNPLTIQRSSHPGSLFPYSGLMTNENKDRTLHEEEDSALLDTDYSPVFNPCSEKSVQIVPRQQTSLIRGSMTSNIVRRANRNAEEAVSSTRKGAFVTTCDETDVHWMSDGSVKPPHVIEGCLETYSDQASARPLTLSSSLDGYNEQKTSLFAAVPSMKDHLQDDNGSMYSDEQCSVPEAFIDWNKHTQSIRHPRRVGLSKGSANSEVVPQCSPSSPVTMFANPYSKIPNAKLENGIAMNGDLRFPSSYDCEAKPVPSRTTQIPIEFSKLNEYKNVFRAALKEHLNILLFNLAKTYHAALKKANITIDLNTTSGVDKKTANGPSCVHGQCSLRTVRKPGPNKGKLFYTCPGNAANQCKFFVWADEFQKKANPKNGRNKKEQGSLILSDSNSVNVFFSGQGVSFYYGCKLLRKEKDSFYNFSCRGKSKWGKGKTKKQMDGADCHKTLSLSLPYKASSSTYSKDDLWIISKNLHFDPPSSFIAKSTFYGPSSAGDVQITALSAYCPSNWESGETVHAILACNAGTELSCINNLDNINGMNDVPVLPYLMFRNVPQPTSRISASNKFSCPVLATESETIFFNKDEVMELVQQTVTKHGLNDDQAAALSNIANMFTDHSNKEKQEFRITLIHGVFGAGKSFLLAVVILFMVDVFERNRQMVSDIKPNKSWKILVSSTTNVAVDRVLEGLLGLGFEDFVRVGSVRKISKPVLPYSVHATGSDDQELRELQSMLKSELSTQERAYVRRSIERHKVGLNKKKLQEVPVVGVTCAASVFPCMDNLSFKVHLLDECSQMTEPLSMLPIARFQCEKLILVGDPKQLSPTIQGSEAENKCGLERTLFDRLKEKGIKPVMLKTQYRCHPMISAIPNSLFYKGVLCDGVDEVQRSPLLEWLNPVCFYNVSNGKEKCGTDGSFYNLEEANFVVFLINSMLLFGIEPSHIGVITQYKSQTHKISSLLQEQSSSVFGSELKSIQISTVDAFQGAEKEIIVLSCVRTDHVGFIDCYRRTNVALSRAKRHLLIVGNLRILVQNSLWSNIIECCSRNADGITSSKVFREKLEPLVKEQLDEKAREAEETRGMKKKKRKEKKNFGESKTFSVPSTVDSKITDTSVPEADEQSTWNKNRLFTEEMGKENSKSELDFDVSFDLLD